MAMNKTEVRRRIAESLGVEPDSAGVDFDGLMQEIRRSPQSTVALVTGVCWNGYCFYDATGEER